MVVKRADVTDGAVVGEDGWVVGVSHDRTFAVSRRCRHQFADLADGHVDDEGCLVCPWHQSKYDVVSGEMVQGPQGFLGYHGPVPGYAQAVRLLGRVWRLRVGSVKQAGGNLTVE